MEVKGQGDSSYAASEGADPRAKIDLSAVPEAPIKKGEAAPAPVAAPAAVEKPPVAVKPTPVVVKPAPVAVKPAPKPVEKPAATESASAAASGPGQIQLGAFANAALANSAWKSLSGRFSVLAPLSQSVVQAEVNGKTVYRLRASAGGQAKDICAKLKVAGEACLLVK
jgi:cell division protein FtsN